MAESFNFSVGPIGHGGRPGKIKTQHPQPTLEQVLKSIGSLPVSSEEKRTLESAARRVPNGSLGTFLSNYRTHLKGNG